MDTKTIDVQAVDIKLTDLVQMLQVHAEIVLMQGTTPIARLSSITEPQTPKRRRIAGLHRGGWVSDDFNEPLPDEFWLGDE